MKLLAFLPAFACLLATTSANDRTRDVQAALKGQGFYYGEVTGLENAETAAAIRRFQIRSGINVTGTLNGDTLAALGLVGKKAASPAPPSPTVAANKQLNPATPAPAPAKPDAPIKKPAAQDPESETKDAPQPHRGKPSDRSVIEPPVLLPAAVAGAFSTMFRDTPYAAAPREVQMDIVRRAQSLMAARRFYRGPINGVAGPATSEAIFLFQDDGAMRRTGRLDPDTLAEMKLLPPPAPGTPLLKPFYNPNRRRDRSVLSE